ncbi:MAG: type III secretion system inner membrane ring subunit SctD [Burkholderiaceae bacterium]
MKIEPQLEALLPQLELRVLHGPQAGSRLTLAVGEYMLGTDDDCEVILAGPRLMGLHAKLKIDADAAILSPVDGSVLDGHGKHIAADTPLALGMPVEIGGIWVSIDEVDAPWPSTETLIPQPGIAAPSESLTHEEPLELASPETPAGDDVEHQRVRARRILIASLSVLATIGIASIFGAFWLSHQATPVAQPVVDSQPLSNDPSLSERLTKAFPGRTIKITQSNGKSSVVTAYASDQPMATRMLQLIRKFDSAAVTHIFVDDAMLESARAASQKYRQEGHRAIVQVTGINNGVISARGWVGASSVRDEVLENLKNSAPGIRSVEAAFQGAEELPTLFIERLTAADLSTKLKIVSKQPELVLRGSLTEDEIQRWEKLLIQFNEEFGQLMPIRTSITVAQKLPPVNIQTIVGGTMPFIITDTGQRIGIGGEANGHTITSIKDDEIVFDGTQRYRISR